MNHAAAALPNEGCGLFAVDATGAIRHVYPLKNIDISPVRFTVDPDGHSLPSVMRRATVG